MLKILFWLMLQFLSASLVYQLSIDKSLSAAEIGTKQAQNDSFVYLISGHIRHDEETVKLGRYMVSIRSSAPQKYFGDNHYCAGVIITSKIVLTAAHCVMDKRKVLTRVRKMLVVAGTPNRLRKANTTRVYKVAWLKPHPNYVRHNSDNIALICIKREFDINNTTIAILPLPDSTPPYGDVCVLLGWGRVYYNGPLATELLHVDLELYTKEQCEMKVPDFTQDALCGGHSEGDGACRGDAGSPFICNETLVGIVSWTLGCGSKDYPTLLDDVFYHREWILSHYFQSGCRLTCFGCIWLIVVKIFCERVFLNLQFD